MGARLAGAQLAGAHHLAANCELAVMVAGQLVVAKAGRLLLAAVQARLVVAKVMLLAD